MNETIPQLEPIEYAEFRPKQIRALSKEELLSVIDKSLAPIETGRAKSMDTANLCFLELRKRRRVKATKEAMGVFRDYKVEPIAWFESARKVVTTNLKASENRKKKGRVYVILRDGYINGGPFGVYVGSTRLSVEKRFCQHMQGIRAGRGLQKYGIELMYSLFQWMNPVPGKNEFLRQEETRLHHLLAGVVPKVTGDVDSDEKA